MYSALSKTIVMTLTDISETFSPLALRFLLLFLQLFASKLGKLTPEFTTTKDALIIIFIN